jgi:hypothetical protein
MGEYAVLIYSDEKAWETAPESISNEVMDGHMKFGEKHAAAIRGGHALESAQTATSVRNGPKGDVQVTDGPFTETKEALGGFYVIEAPDLDAALKIARDIPFPFGGLEVRPIRVFD